MAGERVRIGLIRGAIGLASIDVSPDGKTLLTGGRRGTVWNLETGEPVLELDGDVEQSAAKLGKQPNPLLVFPALDFRGVAFRPDGERIVACGDNGTVRVWDAKKGKKPLLSFPLSLPTYGRTIDCVSFSPDETRILAASSNGTAKLADATTGAVHFEFKSRKRRTFEGIIRMFQSNPKNAAFSPDGSRIVLAGGDRSVPEVTV